MYTVKWYQANGLYCATGSSSANSLFFETKNDHVLFLNLWNRFMGGMAELVHYSFTPVSWAFVFKTSDSDDIKSFYNEKRSQSKKAKLGCEKTSVGEMISEHFRYMISNFVPKSNQSLGKNGSRVKHRFKKFGFWAQEDYQEIVRRLERLYRWGEQNLEKYRPDEAHYDEEKELRFGDEFQSSKLYRAGDLVKHFCLDFLFRIGNNQAVLRQLLKSTLQHHFPNKNPPP